MYYFVINPLSSSGKGIKVWNKVEDILDQKNVEYESFILEQPGDAKELAGFLSLNKTPCTITVVGGDGTINEFLSGLTTCQGITFFYIPTGSGNDFARGMHLTSNPAEAVDILLSPSKFRNINIGITTSGQQKSYFAVSSGIGFDASVCYASHQSGLKTVLNKLHMGKLIYLINALRLLITSKPFSVRLLMNDSQLLTFQKIRFITAMNTKYEGGGFMFCPKASPVDDELDLFVVDDIPTLKVLAILPTAFFGKHTNIKGIHIYRCKRAVVQAEAEACVHVDGEHFGYCSKVAFDLSKEKLKMIVD
ncbi:MAG: diacylglycerol kinase family lipid kinase [Lachnospiraceae bacterium]|nr:diacylglycerol kinase family lipid kinase [Lachnospiraceae bacterium]